jgi:hypothetical protein
LRGVQGRKRWPYTESPNSPRPNSSARSILIIFHDIEWIFHKELVQAGQTVISAYYYGVLWRLHENMGRLLPELWRRKNWLLHHDYAPSHTSFFIREFSLSRLKIELKGRHFYTTEVIEAESHAVLNTLRDHDFQDAF